jgi:ubiquinone/menaquinone biosynthesis C-methylase UbiE
MTKANQYDDPTFNYQDYWDGRDYENAAEELALNMLLGSNVFEKAADIGGGFGRLAKLLRSYAKHVTVVEPSKQQRDRGKDFTKGLKDVDFKDGQGDKLPFKDGELGLITMIRVMHHLPDPKLTFKELNRVLDKDGTLILEVANSLHFKSRLKAAARLKRVSKEPVERRSETNIKEESIAFVNHHPKVVSDQLERAGFKVEKILSVSNLRSPGLKKVLPEKAMIRIERVLQPALARFYFGPSVFFRVRKK